MTHKDCRQWFEFQLKNHESSPCHKRIVDNGLNFDSKIMNHFHMSLKNINNGQDLNLEIMSHFHDMKGLHTMVRMQTKKPRMTCVP